ncbi:helix-turn-helix transcriptional regulator [Vibrio parahaemolyticus]|uniref:helix-turn-helix transcriptional regulator n=2 Tax=Vibrio parahaemolyticus TaxID=670 RepID=UPI000B77E3DC|nr:helix-turn-helix domain-containing protein [Vibrio parahaemolyticus]EGR1195889.1 helix-turn-helix domain-containing protein [Vibrio parahaemolyticus]EGR1204969.1 helix-turn-helix domain-containing protein [Vibrio parahaemolyticus]EGR1210994.1 helix-turn-helix domain-containing protein [Vibrio parahaemolyticus]EGR1215979.1 helix-turn-helix domain-containing protein [Vibrio parahaemolyticus]EGR1217621.1 helix-turn-helix domain-containing protein [Vibrio parahaemolyticus]
MKTTRYYDYSRNMTKEELSRILTKKEVALLLGKSISTVGRMIKDGRLPVPLKTQQGRNGGWTQNTILRWLKKQSESQPSNT